MKNFNLILQIFYGAFSYIKLIVEFKTVNKGISKTQVLIFYNIF